MSKISILKTAHIDCADSVLFFGASKDTSTVIGCHAFLIEKNGEYSLIDTGIESCDVANLTKSSKADWMRGGDEKNIVDCLKDIGVSPEQITKVFLSHSHYDHISGVVHFKNAKFYMTEKEYESFLSEDNKLKDFLKPAKDFLKDKEIITFKDELTVGDFKLKIRGGHTKGSMSIEFEDYLFSGDTIFVQDNLRRKIAAGFTESREESDKILSDYLKSDKKIITSHDFNEVI